MDFRFFTNFQWRTDLFNQSLVHQQQPMPYSIFTIHQFFMNTRLLSNVFTFV